MKNYGAKTFLNLKHIWCYWKEVKENISVKIWGYKKSNFQFMSSTCKGFIFVQVGAFSWKSPHNSRILTKIATSIDNSFFHVCLEVLLELLLEYSLKYFLKHF